MADETIIEIEKVPPVVLNKASQVFGKTVWHKAVEVQNDDGKIAYELDGTNVVNNEVTVTITKEGKMVEYDILLKDPTKTPSKVLGAVQKKWPNFKLDESRLLCLGEDLKSQNDGERLYDLSGKRAKKNVQAQVSNDGEILEFVNEWELEKVPKIVSDALNKAKGEVFTADTVYVINENNRTIGFKFEGKGPKGLSKCFFVTTDGKRVERVDK
ncbi:MAG: hypothetical protein RL595_272 [Planctomycetota bacterium]